MNYGSFNTFVFNGSLDPVTLTFDTSTSWNMFTSFPIVEVTTSWNSTESIAISRKTIWDINVDCRGMVKMEQFDQKAAAIMGQEIEDAYVAQITYCELNPEIRRRYLSPTLFGTEAVLLQTVDLLVTFDDGLYLKSSQGDLYLGQIDRVKPENYAEYSNQIERLKREWSRLKIR